MTYFCDDHERSLISIEHRKDTIGWIVQILLPTSITYKSIGSTNVVQSNKWGSICDY